MPKTVSSSFRNKSLGPFCTLATRQQVMDRNLDDLTKQDWDTLFPIELVDYESNWPAIYLLEKEKILAEIGDKIIRIEHVGSTSIPNLRAKPYIDICIEINTNDLFNSTIIGALRSQNYHFFRQTGQGIDYMVFVKGYHPDGKKSQVFHVHMCPPDHKMLDQIIFRDYLRANTQRAKAYEQLKRTLAITYKNDRTGYRIAKNDFIEETMQMAREH